MVARIISGGVLFTIAQDGTYNTTNTSEKLEGLRNKGFDKYYHAESLDRFIEGLKVGGNDDFNFRWYPHNAPGQWMSKNIDVPSKVITEPITIERLEQELEAGNFGHVVVSTYLSGYRMFREVADYVHNKHPKVKVIAGSVGALIPESSKFADFVLRGDQVTDLRMIIGRSVNDPLRVVTVGSDTETSFGDLRKSSRYALLVSSLGCMYGCDFCPSTAQFGTSYSSISSAEEVRDAILSARNEISPDRDTFTVSLAEPQGMGNIRLWKDVFRICRDLPFRCNLVSTTSSRVIGAYDLEELVSGNLKLSTVNIGVESLLQGYHKNKNVDLKSLILQLQSAGIDVVSTFIIGLDWHTKENLREEVELLKGLCSNGYIVANLEMQPGTPLYECFRANGRLLNVPPELLSFYGYQAYTHPHFVTGFDCMLPLLEGIGRELSGNGGRLSDKLKAFLRRTSVGEFEKRLEIESKIKAHRDSLRQKGFDGDAVEVMMNKFMAELYFREMFSQVDLFHPFILSTN